MYVKAFVFRRTRSGPFVRPHPALWRAVLGVSVLYLMGLIFLLFHKVEEARQLLRVIDPDLGYGGCRSQNASAPLVASVAT